MTGGGPHPTHYSYAVYADPTLAESFDAARFGGPIGALLASSQEAVLRQFLGSVAGRRIVDVGTGTGRGALALARRGASVVGIDASAEMLAVAERRARAAGLVVEFARGDAHALKLPDSSFDASVCLRVLMHTPDWRRCLGELCRVARQVVVFDYPGMVSAAALQSGWRRVAFALGRPTEPYRVFTDRSIRRELARHGFRVVAAHRQFVLPIAVHKMVGSPRVTRRSEAWLARLGFLRLAGSPVTVLAERCGS